MDEFLTRAVDFTPLPEEERAAKDGDGRTLEGYAAVFDTDTEINSWEGKFNERITRGAFRKTLKERTPVLQFDHGHDSRFGSLPIGAFDDIREDKHGLKVTARLFDHAEPIREAIASGAITGMSFRFKVVRDQWTDAKGNVIKDRQELMDALYGDPSKKGPLQRTIKEVKLMEAGPVVFPAYPETTVGVRSMNEAERESLVDQYAATGDVKDVTDEDVERESQAAADSLAGAGIDAEDALAFVEFLNGRGENPFAKKAKDGEKPKPGAKPDPNADCTCDKVDGKHKVSAHKKTSSSGEKPKSEKKSEDDTSSAPEVGDDAAEPRSESDDAALAGTSTGLTQNARERSLYLLELEGNTES